VILLQKIPCKKSLSPSKKDPQREREREREREKREKEKEYGSKEQGKNLICRNKGMKSSMEKRRKM